MTSPRHITLSLFALLSLSQMSWAEELDVRKDPQEPNVVQTLQKLRMKQQGEEQRVIRVIQGPVTYNKKRACSEIQQSRQRLRDLGRGKDYGMGGDINGVIIDAGNDHMTIDGNEGQIYNNINMNVEAPDEDRCL